MAESEQYVAVCPACEVGHLKVHSMLYSVPFFNELALFTMECPDCNFSHNDVFSAEQRRPRRWTLRVDEKSKLYIRVVRSGSGTVRLPEFGIDIEPGPAAESYISNVEGVLLRTRPVVESAINFAESETQKKRGRELLTEIDLAIAGEHSFTLVIEDPAGVSGILPDDLSLVQYEELTREEASELKGAPLWMDAVRDEYLERKG
ncbi:MAG: ZPR1 zinc finger domain-containing protein [Candidatus Thorarchaeota archaeon]|nr:MAG: ZPR1 zinc finger domain-containing protein [Candidatus Thorarchaeota archaeon]